MSTKEIVDEALLELCAKWNAAEKAIKVAEQVNGEIVNPAIYELRYAGRRVVEALAKKDDFAGAKKLLDDAIFDCCRARHDAIDAATSKITSDIDNALEKLGPENVLKYFPACTDLIAELEVTREKIAVSRENRENRDAIYDTIEATNFEKIVSIHGSFRSSESLIKQAARKDRRNNKFSHGLGIVGAIGVILTIIFGVYPMLTEKTTAAIAQPQSN